ncbi:MAG: DUF1801 domain-containing protein [Planctomycetota bacterium]|jgi:uncharacterized protein YdhG (YjbR/CyaY superfamily)
MRKEIEAYILDAPEEQRDALRRIHDKIAAEMPDVEPISPNGFPVWTIDGEWCAGFASRKKGVMLYVMVSSVLDRYAEKLGRLRTGRGCVEWKASKTLSLEELDALADVMIREAYETLTS